MLDPTLAAAYLVFAIALAVAPGPDTLFVIANGMRHRVRGAIASALGVGFGSLLHALTAAIGVSAVVAASPVAFDMLRYAGAAYLAYLGLQALRMAFSAQSADTGKPVAEPSVWIVFRRGLVTNVLNPKVIVFYIALLPQFVNADLGHIGLQMFLLGSIHNAVSLVFLVSVGLAAGRASDWLASTRFSRWLDGIAGLFFVALALHLIISERAGP
jgi:threonine/homoserine/homoserine lactone efflux protein